MSRKNDLDDLEIHGTVGDWAFINHDNHIAIRYGEDSLTGTVILPITGPKAWQWNGDKEKPTLTPSILIHPVPNWNVGWHGWLRDGVLVNA